MPSPSRYYSSTAAKTTLSSAIDSVSTSLQLAAASGLPSQYPFTLILEKDTANEEIVEVTGLIGTAYQITRNIDQSGAKAHSIGASVEHGVSARDFTESRAHEIATNAHGVTGDVVGTGGAQTLTGKTLTSAILGNALDAGGFKITNLATPTSSSDAVRKDFADLQVASAATSATSAATSASSAATSAASALTSATSAATSASSALVSQTAAATSAASAATSASSAATSASTMLASVTAAATSAASALVSQTAAATSASSALTSQSSAAISASSAATSATAAATSATSAANSATTAAASVAAIAGYASAAATSEANALTSANSAATSASSAATSASTMLASVTAAATSAASAATSATSAATSATSAQTSATNAAAYELSANNWATQTSGPVAGGEYSSKYHAIAASTSASSASTSASSALTSQSSAATSASSALTSQTSAATSATSAAASAVLASEWATKTTGTVDGTEYSAKYYAQQANPAGNINAATYTAKGVILVGTGSGTFTQLSAGTSGQYLVVDTTTATGLKYLTLPDPISPLLLMGA